MAYGFLHWLRFLHNDMSMGMVIDATVLELTNLPNWLVMLEMNRPVSI